MIRKLRIKFICVIMAIVMVLLGCILGLVIHFTAKSMEMQSISMMRTIAATPFQQGVPGKLRIQQAGATGGVDGSISCPGLFVLKAGTDILACFWQ